MVYQITGIQIFNMLLMLSVLIIYYENELFLMLRISPYAYRHLQDIIFCFIRRSTVVQCVAHSQYFFQPMARLLRCTEPEVCRLHLYLPV